MDELERPSALPIVAWVVVGVLVLLGVVTIVGWVLSTAMAMIKLVVLALLVVGVFAGWRAMRARA